MGWFSRELKLHIVADGPGREHHTNGIRGNGCHAHDRKKHFHALRRHDSVPFSGCAGRGRSAREIIRRNHVPCPLTLSPVSRKLAVKTALTSFGRALAANSLCQAQEKHTMCKLEVQIANSGLVRSLGEPWLKNIPSSAP